MIYTEDKYAPLGGQAVIEGVMMRGNNKIAVAVRKPKGVKITKKTIEDLKKEHLSKKEIKKIESILGIIYENEENLKKQLIKLKLNNESIDKVVKYVVYQDEEIKTNVWEYIPWKERNKIWGFPFIRGLVALIESLYWGFKTLNYSANVVYEELEEKESPFMTTISFLFALAIAIALFMALPGFIFIKLKPYVTDTLLLNSIEGLIRIFIFIVYLYLIRLIPEIRRVFQYHGAEHKVIHAYEHKKELNWDNIKDYSPEHSRCGTSFLLITLIISILVFSLLGKSPDLITRVISKLALLPVVAGISYELIRLAGKLVNIDQEKSIINKIAIKLAFILTLPGLWLQKITTDEPDPKQVEVAIISLKLATS